MKKRPAGVTLVSSALIAFGGFLTTVIFLSVVDSINRFGMESLILSSPMALLGFFIYGLSPLLFYVTGINLFTAKRWAWLSTVSLIPIAGFAMFFNWACLAARKQSVFFEPGILDLISGQSPVFIRFMFPYFLLFTPILYYFCLPEVVEYFREGESVLE